MYVPFCKTIDDVTFQLSLRHHFWPRLKETVEHNHTQRQKRGYKINETKSVHLQPPRTKYKKNLLTYVNMTTEQQCYFPKVHDFRRIMKYCLKIYVYHVWVLLRNFSSGSYVNFFITIVMEYHKLKWKLQYYLPNNSVDFFSTFLLSILMFGNVVRQEAQIVGCSVIPSKEEHNRIWCHLVNGKA